MRDSDLADYLDHDPFLGEPVQPKLPSSVELDRAPQLKRLAETERDQFVSDVLRIIMDIFPGARWTIRQEYTRASANRDRKGRRKRE
jgi:hypothetical protein